MVALAAHRGELDATPGDAGSVLSAVVSKASGHDIIIHLGGPEEALTIELPDGLFEAGCKPEGLAFEGEGQNRREQVQSAALRALGYICQYIDLLPPLKKLSDSGPLGLGTNRVVVGRLSLGTSEQSLRAHMVQFGAVRRLTLREGTGEGTATYEHRLSAWIAERMLMSSALDGSSISVEQQQEALAEETVTPSFMTPRITPRKRTVPPRAAAAQRPQPEILRWRSRDFQIMYFGAPPEASFNEMKKHFMQVGHVVIFQYLIDPQTKKSLGKGSAVFGSAEAADKAMEKLQDMTVRGKKLRVEFRRD